MGLFQPYSLIVVPHLAARAAAVASAVGVGVPAASVVGVDDAAMELVALVVLLAEAVPVAAGEEL